MRRLLLAVVVLSGALLMLAFIVGGIALADAGSQHGWLPQSHQQAQGIVVVVGLSILLAGGFLLGIWVSTTQRRFAATIVVLAATVFMAGSGVIAGFRGWMPPGRGPAVFVFPFLAICVIGLRAVFGSGAGRGPGW